MRLGQLARKLSLRPSEIVEFLAANNIQIGEGSNARVEDDHALIVIKHFAPGLERILKEEEEPEISTATVTPEVEITPTIEQEEQAIPEAVAQSVDSNDTDALPAVSDEEKEREANIGENGVIKAPKIELPGLKVIGKIDLPEPKKKEPTPPVEGEPGEVPPETPKRPQRDDRKPYQKGDRNERRPKKNPIALQREREAQEAERKKLAEAQAAKERRTNNYLKKVKPTQPVRAAKLIQEEYDAMDATQDAKPTSWFGRLVRWLTRP